MLNGKTILIVEDDTVSAKMLSELCLGFGMTVLGVVDLAENAVNEALRLQPDIITMDVQFPEGIDGIEAATRIKAHKDIPIVFITSFHDPVSMDRAKAIAADGYFTKPVRLKETELVLDLALFRRQMEKDLQAQHRRYDDVLELTQDCIFEWDLSSNEMNISRHFLHSLKILEDRITTRSGWDTLINPEDRESIALALRDHFVDKTPKYICEYRLQGNNGRWLWVQERGRISGWDERGKPNLIIGAISDIHERKEREEMLNRLLQELEWCNWEVKTSAERLKQENAIRQSAEAKVDELEKQLAQR